MLRTVNVDIKKDVLFFSHLLLCSSFMGNSGIKDGNF